MVNFIILTLFSFTVLFSSSCATAQTSDQVDALLGTWKGERYHPRFGAEEQTLVITKSSDGKLIGTLTSYFNGDKSKQKVEIRVSTENGSIILQFTRIYRQYSIYYNLTLASDYLEGTAQASALSNVKLTRQ